MECPYCKNDTQGNYCENCGQRMFVGHCSHCRQEVFGNYCSNCGTLFKPQGFIIAIKALVNNQKFQQKIGSIFPIDTRTQAFLDRMNLCLKSLKDFEVKPLEALIPALREDLEIHGTLAKEYLFDASMVEMSAKILLALAQHACAIDSIKGARNGLIIAAHVPDNKVHAGGNLLCSVELLPNYLQLNIDAKIRGRTHTLEDSKQIIRLIQQAIEATEVKALFRPEE